ncbi:MAG: hypothetical protein HOI07_10425, partial [Betaproteobacteria bacterium]|nr:hypothetical protein [Betaproteobacteria bacterium]
MLSADTNALPIHQKEADRLWSLNWIDHLTIQDRALTTAICVKPILTSNERRAQRPRYVVILFKTTERYPYRHADESLRRSAIIDLGPRLLDRARH